MFLVHITLVTGMKIQKEAADIGEAQALGYEACRNGFFQSFVDGYIRVPASAIAEVRCIPKPTEEEPKDGPAKEKAPVKRRAVSKRKAVAKKSAD